MKIPNWMTKHPCTACGKGYGVCSQGWKRNLMCCKDCEHPTRVTEGYTAEDYREMWGKHMPENVRKMVERMEQQ